MKIKTRTGVLLGTGIILIVVLLGIIYQNGGDHERI